MPDGRIEHNDQPGRLAFISDGFVAPFMEKGEYGTWLREEHARQYRGIAATPEAGATTAETAENTNLGHNRREPIEGLTELRSIEAEAVALFDA